MQRIIRVLTLIYVLTLVAGCIGNSGGNEKIEPPVISPESGSYTTEVAITISCSTRDTDIWYTTDGSEPKKNESEFYNGNELKITKNTVIKAIATTDYLTSKVATSNFTISGDTKLPDLPKSGVYSRPFTLKIQVEADTQVIYTLDGTNPSNENGVKLNKSTELILNESVILKLIAVKEGWKQSNIAERKYTILEQVSEVKFSKSTGNYVTSIQVEMTSLTPGVKIRYTVDGSEPTIESQEYSEALLINADKIIKAKAFKDNCIESNTSTATYSIVGNKAENLTENSWTKVFLDDRNNKKEMWYYAELEEGEEYYIKFSDRSNNFYNFPDLFGTVKVYDSSLLTELLALNNNYFGKINSANEGKRVWINVIADSDSSGYGYIKLVKASELYTDVMINNREYQQLDVFGDSIRLKMSGLYGKNIYFIFTNTNEYGRETPKIENNFSVIANKNSGGVQKNELQLISKDNYKSVREDSKFVSEFNKNPLKYRDGGLSKSQYKKFKERVTRGYNINDTNIFNTVTSEGVGQTVAKLKKIVTVNGRKLYIWVENDSWERSGKKVFEVNQQMVDEMADSFIKEGENNDIYDWVTKISGEPWGVHKKSDYIGDTNEIHILLEDIYRDNSIDGGVLGYFWTGNNMKASSFSLSNEKLMFVVDSVMFAEKEGASWEKSDQWPSEIISTLSHEFQHMITFYQKNILNNCNLSTWYNEMTSMCIEDFLAKKMGIPGPRGVGVYDGSAGNRIFTTGRIPIYNVSDYINITNWEHGGASYSNAYAYGAYLMRNYGGAAYLSSMIKNSTEGEESIEKAIYDMGYGKVNFGDTLARFGMAVLLSDRIITEPGYRFNAGGWFNSMQGGNSYDLGSINFYNYSYNGAVGPYITPKFEWYDSFRGKSNTYYLAGEKLTGDKEWYIYGLRENVKMSIVVK